MVHVVVDTAPDGRHNTHTHTQRMNSATIVCATLFRSLDLSLSLFLSLLLLCVSLCACSEVNNKENTNAERTNVGRSVRHKTGGDSKRCNAGTSSGRAVAAATSHTHTHTSRPARGKAARRMERKSRTKSVWCSVCMRHAVATQRHVYRFSYRFSRSGVGCFGWAVG